MANRHFFEILARMSRAGQPREVAIPGPPQIRTIPAPPYLDAAAFTFGSTSRP